MLVFMRFAFLEDAKRHRAQELNLELVARFLQPGSL